MRSQRRLVRPINEVYVAPNTFFGNMGGVFTSKTILANAMQVLESIITSFEITENDVMATIGQDWRFPTGFLNAAVISSFQDLDGKMLGAVSLSNASNTGGFYNCDSLLEVIAPNCESVNDYCFYSCNFTPLIYAPKVKVCGSTLAHNGSFQYVGSAIGNSGATVVLNNSLRTSNAGGVEGDLQKCISQGNTVVTPTDSQIIQINPITDLTFTVSGGNVILNFTPPSLIYALQKYDVRKRRFKKVSDLAGSGSSVSGLANGDIVTVRTYDQYYNFSESNEIIISGL